MIQGFFKELLYELCGMKFVDRIKTKDLMKMLGKKETAD